MVLSSAMEAVGYIACCLSIKNVTDKDFFVVQFALVVLAPVLMAASLYVVFVIISFLYPQT